ncbi:hypothetical protein ATER59S_02372 [Aquamicrobium terrae]
MQLAWFGRWFLNTYLLAVATQGGALVVIGTMLGHGADINRYLSENRALGTLALVAHFLFYLFSAIFAEDEAMLDQVKTKELDDE